MCFECEMTKAVSGHRRAVTARFLRRTGEYEDRLARKLIPYFGKQKKVVLALLHATATKSITDVEQAAWDDLDAELQALIKPLYDEIILSTGGIIAADIGASFSVLNDRVLAFVESKLAKIVDCNRTTQDAIEAVLRAGLEHGDDIQFIANGIEGVFEDAIGNRAVVIARTEVIGASNWATFEAYTQSEVVALKEWLTTVDGRQRPAHEDANNQAVPLKEPFIVDGEELMYPGDPAGSAENIIQCRCTLVAVIK